MKYLPIRMPVLLFFDWLESKGWWSVDMTPFTRGVYDWMWTAILLQLPLAFLFAGLDAAWCWLFQ